MIEGQTHNIYLRASLANPLIRPEHTQEHEFGMDATLFGGRVDMGITGYRRRTNDQINNIQEPAGLPLLQWVNLGDVSGRGIEATATWHMVQRSSWNLNVILAYNQQTTKLIRLGAGLPGGYYGGGSLVPGYPLGSAFGNTVAGYADTAGGGPDSVIISTEAVLSPLRYLGVLFPPRTLNVTPSLTLLHGYLSVSTSFDRQTGFLQLDPIINDNCADEGLCLAGLLKSAPLIDQANASARIDHFEPGDFTRWRELSITATVPLNLVSWLRIGSAQVSIQGRNLALWTKYKGPDPESQPESGVTALASSSGAFGIPFPRTWSIRFDVNP